MESNKMKFRCSDDKIVEIDRELTKYFSSITETIEENPDEEFPLLEIDSSIMHLIVEFLEYLQNQNPADIPYKACKIENFKELVGEWQHDWINKIENNQTLVNLTLAANYLSIPKLMRLTCCKIAEKINGRTAEQLR